MVNTIAQWRLNFRDTYGILPSLHVREDFLRCCQIEGDCWVWRGEPTFQIGNHRYDPVRLAHVFLIGPLAPDMNVRSTCGKSCCMPDHMECFTESKVAAHHE